MKSIIFNQHQVNHALKNKEGMFRKIPLLQPTNELAIDSLLRLYKPYEIEQLIFVKEKFVKSIFGKPIYFDEDFRWFQGKEKSVKWKSPVHMKQEHSRLTLRIKSVKIEKLQDISEEDCWKEGCEEFADYQDVRKVCEMANQIGDCIEDARPPFAVYWNATHKKPEEKWEANPFVFCFSYEVVR